MNACPDPIEHAAVLIDVCQSDPREAREAARINYLYAANDTDAAYWFAVLCILTPNERAQA